MNDKVELNCRTQLASMAYEELEKGDHQMAIKLLTTSIRLQPDNFELYFERSICHHKLGDHQASLNDINTAISLKGGDYNLYYQKGLALLGLKMRSEAMTTFKKSIELCARQEDTKFSDIFNLLKNASHEFKAVKEGTTEISPSQQAANTTRSDSNGQVQTKRTNNTTDPTVDSTTDRPNKLEPGTSSRHQNATLTNHHIVNKNGNNDLVASLRNIIPPSNILRIHKLPESAETNGSKVSSSANHLLTPFNSMPPEMASLKLTATNLLVQPNNGVTNEPKPIQFDWNIRRSERIFLHHSNEGQSSIGIPQIGIVTRFNEPQVPSAPPKNESNPPPVNISDVTKQSAKRPYDNHDFQTYQQKALLKSKDGTNSQNGSDVDVDDSYSNNQVAMAPGTSELGQSSHKRVMIAPSSSMPATTVAAQPLNKTSKDDYSSNYKRLRRDRERARRGTSKLCTIKLADLEELQRATSDSPKRYMRVIAPVDGWLYSGQLSIDENSNTNPKQYVVKLDGDASGSSYLFNQDTVLNDIIREVQVKSVSELRKGARICCYWSRQYKCLSTGIVTSRTFEATKSLVSVKYDNGDLSALPLEDLRLLPPDYPKYMSNCDPLLLARSGHGAHSTAALPVNGDQTSSRAIVELVPSNSDTRTPNGVPQLPEVSIEKRAQNVADKSLPTLENTKVMSHHDQPLTHSDKLSDVNSHNFIGANNKFEDSGDIQTDMNEISGEHDDDEDDDDEDDDEDATIPPTDETIEFITGESSLKQNEEYESTRCVDDTQVTKDNITLTDELPMNANSRASSEENNYAITYCPWMFEGTPRKNKRHGRTYRDTYSSIRRGSEIIRIGDAAELMPRDESILPFIAKIDGLWATGRGEMRVRVRWYYRLAETEGEPYDLRDGENALFETDHVDENDVQSIYRSTKILSWSNYRENHLGHVNKNNDTAPKIFYLAGHYDPVRRIKHLRSDVKEAQD